MRAAAWVAVVAALLTLVIAHGGADAGSPASLEVDIADGVGAGEPELAVDTVHHVVLISYTASEVCKIAVSSDSGSTWQIASHPADPGPTPGVPYHNCSDSAAATGGEGRMYVGAGWWDQPAGAVDDYNMYVSGSGNDGRTWSPSAFATGDNAAAQNLALARNSGHTDRLFLTADASTGTVYGTAVDFPRTQRWIVASHDGGRSFGPPHAIDSVQYPEGGVPNDYIPSAANGVIAVAYDADGAGCPCNIFETSHDDGVTWTRRFSPIQAEWTAADPAHPGHFAVMSGFGITARTNTPDSVVVSSTSDYGRTWTKPVFIGQDPQNMRYQPWIAFSPTGVLGVGYKTVYGNVSGGSYDYWAAISYDGGRTFGAPIRMSHAISPSEGPGNNGGDDFSGIALDDEYLYAAWADERSKNGGGLSLYFARTPLDSVFGGSVRPRAHSRTTPRAEAPARLPLAPHCQVRTPETRDPCARQAQREATNPGAPRPIRDPASQRPAETPGDGAHPGSRRRACLHSRDHAAPLYQRTHQPAPAGRCRLARRGAGARSGGTGAVALQAKETLCGDGRFSSFVVTLSAMPQSAASETLERLA